MRLTAKLHGRNVSGIHHDRDTRYCSVPRKAPYKILCLKNEVVPRPRTDHITHPTSLIIREGVKMLQFKQVATFLIKRISFLPGESLACQRRG